MNKLQELIDSTKLGQLKENDIKILYEIMNLEQETLDKLNECHTGDTEADHMRADDELCHFLSVLGFDNIVEKYNAVNKWYS